MVGMGLILFGTLFIFIALGIPLAFSLGLSALAGLLFRGDIPLMIMVQRPLAGIDSFPLLAIPLFYLMGSIMTGGGMTKRLFSFAKVLVGFIPGGLGQANVMASMLFAGVSGSAVADVSGLGAIEIPAMIDDEWDPETAAAITAASAIIGPMIPPSIPMVVYGSMIGVSVGALLLGGAVPGVLFGVSLMVSIFFVAIRRKYKRYPFPKFNEVVKSGVYAIESLGLMIIVMGGILGGVFTPTEAGAIGVLYSIVITVFILKELTIYKLWNILKETAIFTATIVLIIGMANLFAWMVITSQLAAAFVKFLVHTAFSKIVFLLLVDFTLLLMGTFMETLAGLIMLAPLLAPVANSFQIDPVHFGVVMVFGMCLGMLTPPVGECVYISSKLAGISLGKTARAILPYFFLGAMLLVLISLFPQIVLFLPNLFY